MGKIGIIGFGRIGSAVAYTLMGMGHSILAYDVREEYARASMSDLGHAFPNGPRVDFTLPSDMGLCSVICITAGRPRTPEQSRAELFGLNLGIVNEIIGSLGDFEGTIVNVTNPVDAINAVVARRMGRKRCFGFGCALDSARLQCITKNNIDFVMGEHGEHFVPITSRKERIGEYAGRIREENMYVLKGKGVTEFGPAMHISSLADGIASGKRLETVASVLCNGEYGISGISIGLPIVIDGGRLAGITEIGLDSNERKMLMEGAASIRKTIGNAADA